MTIGTVQASQTVGEIRTPTHFVGGQHVAGTSGRFGDVYDPSTGRVQARVPLASIAELLADSRGRVVAGYEGGYCRFYTKTKTVTSRWPSGIKEGASFVIPTMQ